MREGLNAEKYLKKEDISLPQRKEAEKPAETFEVIEGGKRDWGSLYDGKKIEADNLFRELKAKYKKGKWDKEDPLYQEWVLTKRQVAQIENITALESGEINPTASWEKDLIERKKKAVADEEAAALVQEEEELAAAKKEIGQRQLGALIDAFDSAEVERVALEIQIDTPPEITPELHKISLQEETEAEERELLKKVEKAAKQLVEAEDNLKAAMQKRKNLFRRTLLKLRGKAVPEEINYKKTKEEFEKASKEYEKIWKEAEETGVFSGRASSRLLKMSAGAHEKAEFLTQKTWVKKV